MKNSCIFCGKMDDGIICSHCLAEGASSFGNFVKKASGMAIYAVPLVLTLFAAGKGRKV